jgi:hypothetical protein
MSEWHAVNKVVLTINVSIGRFFMFLVVSFAALYAYRRDLLDSSDSGTSDGLH